jgi:hypothetical protein
MHFKPATSTEICCHQVNRSIINIDSPPIGKGRERTCYVLPDDSTKIVKISGDETNAQTRREVAFYRTIEKKKDFNYAQLPRFYGLCNTNLGEGFIVDLVQDYNGEISKSLRWYLNQGSLLAEFETLLEDLKKYLLEQLIIINHDMVPGNLLLQKLSSKSSRLVLIDGIGDVVAIRWLNYFPSHVRSKIRRRWERFENRLRQQRTP